MMMKKLAALLAVLALGTVACSSDTATPDDTTSSTPATSPTTDETDTDTDDDAEENTVEVIDNEFDPEEIEISAGESVTWIWVDTAELHNVVAEDQSFSSGSPTAEPDTEFTHEFDEAGTYEYICQVHGTEMTGTVTVS